MRHPPIVRVEPHRVVIGAMGSGPEYGNNGAFIIPQKHGPSLRVIVSDGEPYPGDPEIAPPYNDWEHVSVSVHGLERTPTWEEMCFIKELFWKDDEVVIQLHPARKDHISHHPFCLHLWRHKHQNITLPPKDAVGPEDLPERLTTEEA